MSVNRSRGRRDSEFELLDTGVFDEGRCWEITADYHAALGPGFRVECLTGSGVLRNLEEVAAELSDRLVALFVRDPDGRRSVCGGYRIRQEDPAWHDQILFHEYFHADTGAGLGASHQTGWTGIVADLIINKRERTQQ